ncbi:AraC family transcriptional regulator [Desulfosarcina alkanivorans]|uniref:AraC family transcriptional regulator n=1 Tax=Desulfosarcina alkanivorans TaxID=571177 RepID=A0A5K7YSE0_9BACT|nr:AraC family transcriptional regulator [Desulfosarcina alkanivorans]BBO70879.1 AraC family transcriptional regulator [Desulfosarcina alkanivorans]
MNPREKVAFWRDMKVEGVEICRVDGSRHVFPAHAHDGIYAIGMMLSGGSYCLGPENASSLVSPGQIALINPSQVHSGVPVSGKRISYRMVYFDQNLMAAAAAEMAGKDRAFPEFASMVVGDAVLWRRMQRFCRVIQGPGGRLEKESAILDVLAHLISLCGNVTRGRYCRRRGGQSIRYATQFLSENLDRKITLEDVAREAGLSRYHFLRMFKRETGLPPHLFRIMRRIDRGKQLLRGGLPPAQTALAVGFSDQSHFANTFRKYTGATPGQYLSESPR